MAKFIKFALATLVAAAALHAVTKHGVSPFVKARAALVNATK